MSQKLLRIVTLLMTSILTMVLLVGGSFVYNKIIYTNPLEASVTKLPAVGSFKIEKVKARSILTVRFNVKEKLRTNFYLLLDQLENQTRDRLNNLTIEIDNIADEDLSDFIQEARLPIHEAVSTGHLTDLPERLEKLSIQYKVDFQLEADNHFIFLTVNNKQGSAHLIINRGESSIIVINTMGGEYI